MSAAGAAVQRHMDEEDGPLVFAHACKMGLEGIVSKRKDSPYRLGALAGLDQEQEPAGAGGTSEG